ncbi:protein S100-Z-like [Plectropomus leopardus]|uniref:protein S100-Z-like n=1 Tax=Plectropomus leopardus TaxID=160734 RepID=UPI001C4BD5D5|nr:protein S100-Z-like [Plectropomus leopardus]
MADLQMTPLEGALLAITGIYVMYETGSEHLTKERFKELMKNELPNVSGSAGEVEWFDKVDCNDDNKVEFTEFIQMISAFTMAHYDCLKELMQRQRGQRN